MRYIQFLLLLGLVSCELSRARESAKNQSLSEMATPSIHQQLFDHYDSYLEKSITKRRFKHKDLLAVLDSLGNYSNLEIKKVGKSVQQRDICMIKAGTGPVKVMLWSQMHGDEPTATMAMLDIFHFLGKSDEFDSVRNVILKNTTLYFIPMLNPDGADMYERRNALGIDLNRDALQLQSAESKLLKQLVTTIKPDFGFNLHDQNTRYTAGKTSKPATISFLAPPYDHEKSVNTVRSNAMKLIVSLNKTLQYYIPGQVAKYSDHHEPRAFGDNIQKWGTSVILIESGGYAGDPEKQYIRKLNFVTLLNAFYSIAHQSYQKENTDDYFLIPENERYLFDLVVRNALIEDGEKRYYLDIGINRNEVNTNGNNHFYYQSVIDELGDLSVYYGYDELDAAGMKVVPGKTYPKILRDSQELTKLGINVLLQQGYTSVRIKKYTFENGVNNLPINIITDKREHLHQIALNHVPNFLLQENDEVKYAIINGFLFDLRVEKNFVRNALLLH
jgi:hypothetical protein